MTGKLLSIDKYLHTVLEERRKGEDKRNQSFQYTCFQCSCAYKEHGSLVIKA